MPDVQMRVFEWMPQRRAVDDVSSSLFDGVYAICRRHRHPLIEWKADAGVKVRNRRDRWEDAATVEQAGFRL
jgi:hypothetical protein